MEEAPPRHLAKVTGPPGIAHASLPVQTAEVPSCPPLTSSAPPSLTSPPPPLTSPHLPPACPWPWATKGLCHTRSESDGPPPPPRPGPAHSHSWAEGWDGSWKAGINCEASFVSPFSQASPCLGPRCQASLTSSPSPNPRPATSLRSCSTVPLLHTAFSRPLFTVTPFSSGHFRTPRLSPPPCPIPPSGRQRLLPTSLHSRDGLAMGLGIRTGPLSGHPWDCLWRCPWLPSVTFPPALVALMVGGRSRFHVSGEGIALLPKAARHRLPPCPPARASASPLLPTQTLHCS